MEGLLHGSQDLQPKGASLCLPSPGMDLTKQTNKQTGDVQGTAGAEMPSLLGWFLKEILILLETPEALSSCSP